MNIFGHFSKSLCFFEILQFSMRHLIKFINARVNGETKIKNFLGMDDTIQQQPKTDNGKKNNFFNIPEDFFDHR